MILYQAAEHKGIKVGKADRVGRADRAGKGIKVGRAKALKVHKE
jgi:hypothetical protein